MLGQRIEELELANNISMDEIVRLKIENTVLNRKIERLDIIIDIQDTKIKMMQYDNQIKYINDVMNKNIQEWNVTQLQKQIKRIDKNVFELKNASRVVETDRKNQQMMRNTLVFTEIPEIENCYEDLLSTVLTVLNDIMYLEIDAKSIADVRRDDGEDMLRSLDAADEDNDFLRTRSSVFPRPVVVRFVNYLDKRNALAAKYHLKHTTIIKVSDVYSEFINRRRAALRPILQEKRRMGLNVQLVDDALMVNGLKMDLDQLESEQPLTDDSRPLEA